MLLRVTASSVSKICESVSDLLDRFSFTSPCSEMMVCQLSFL